MNLHINPNDSVPIYKQIINQIKYMISSRQLRPGDELLPIRALSENLVVNANTVARAYRALEKDGYVTCQRGAGTTVNEFGSPLSDAEQLKVLRDRAQALVTEARQMKMGMGDVLKLVIECGEEMNVRLEDVE
ncbi:GntR family transcriptional regulator [bacterium AH-315-P07]|nr:GntR family transcriptional regulator [bacterium AH-315-P07]